MAVDNAPVFPYPGGVQGDEPPDPRAGKPGHFSWSRWIKQFVLNLNAQSGTQDDQIAALTARVEALENP